MTVEYLIGAKDTKTLIYRVETCKSLFTNTFCQDINSIWHKQACTLSSKNENNMHSIKCDIENPFKGSLREFKTFALRVAILGGDGAHISKEIALTPKFRCHAENL